jgi:spore coat protein A, manganese oxidase
MSLWRQRPIPAQPTPLRAQLTVPLPAPQRITPDAQGKAQIWLDDYFHEPFGSGVPVDLRTYWIAPNQANQPKLTVTPVLIEATKGVPLDLTVVNNISSPGLPIRNYWQLDGPMPTTVLYKPDLAVVHLHGALVPAAFDGYPTRVPGFKTVFGPGEQKIHGYPNAQPATMLWFHDHTMDSTAVNVYSGQAGLYILRDPQEQALGLPTTWPDELPLMICDKDFSAVLPGGTSQMIYGGLFDTPGVQVPEFKGGSLTVNGVINASGEVRRGVVRLRLLNACTSRMLRIELRDGQNALVPMTVIGTDAGFHPSPPVVERISLASAERVDVLIDTTAVAGQIRMINVVAPSDQSGKGWSRLYANGADATVSAAGVLVGAHDVLALALGALAPIGSPSLLQLAAAAASLAPAAIPLPPNPLTRPPDRAFVLREITDATGPFAGIAKARIATAGPNSKVLTWQGSIPDSEVRVPGTVEIWDFTNTSPDTHPMHIHQCDLTVLSRVPSSTRAQVWFGPLAAQGGLEAEEIGGFKDTVKVPNGCRTRVAVRFGPDGGPAVWHCHILQHEDMGMMRKLTS